MRPVHQVQRVSYTIVVVAFTKPVGLVGEKLAATAKPNMQTPIIRI